MEIFGYSRRVLVALVLVSGAVVATAAQAQTSGKARIVVFRPDSPGGALGRGWPVKVDGQDIGSVQAGSYAVAERAPGPHTLSLEMFDFPGVSKHSVSVAAGQTAYFQVRLKPKSQQSLQGATSFGVIGWAVGSSNAAKAEPNGLFEFVPAAAGAISGLRKTGN